MTALLLPDQGALERAATAAPAVSWLLCTHVANDQLKLALESCLKQTFQDFELLIVANGDAAELVASKIVGWYGNDPRVRVLVTRVRQLPFSLSLGLHEARGELVARMDSDDLSHPSRLQQQVNFMRLHPDVAVLGSAYEIIDATAKVLSVVRPPINDAEIRRSLYTRNPICHPSVMYRRNVILNAGGYVGGLQAEDYDLWVRLCINKQLQFANLPTICLAYRSVGVGQARGAREAYASVAGAQLRTFLVGQGYRWLIGAFVTVAKVILRNGAFRVFFPK